uniref:Uncharacterized protein n=1 Tax=Pyramimonas obovata TaxID=1411642 RepID=A0A7S0N3W3_9CHLO|eukprot:CAMPEP_0118921028 /NCGR_PEP_ID=MMETSP1169-20130426/427_1 /TAXON_ID=36882 /ORGANISM="Pyramimonas obovata, Strain CCMP722" /LENGTH=224 /DNA_ID=CAMNT_0006861675 /DNA_START=81 /DNA_END=755 /DNA_ORIENTATION=-
MAAQTVAAQSIMLDRTSGACAASGRAFQQKCVAQKAVRMPATFKVSASLSRKEGKVQGARPTKTALSAKKGAVKDYSLEHFAPSKTESQRWGYVIANAKFMLDEEEHLAELLRERRRMFTEKEREVDFFIVPEPAWVDALPADVKSRLGRPAAAIVSTDLTWITFMKLRLDKVYKGEMDAMMKDALAVSGDVGEFGSPDKWTAPYTKYQAGWWKVFLPENADNN